MKKNSKEEIKQTKQKMLNALEGIKKFEVTYQSIVTYSKIFKARNKEELIEKFYEGDLEFRNKDIRNGELVDDSLEIYEV